MKTFYRKEEILKEVLNRKARERGFYDWKEMCSLIPPSQKIFVEDCIWEVLNKIDWQGTLE